MQPPEDLLPYRSDLGPGEVGPTLEDYSEVNERVKTWCIRHALSIGNHDSFPSFVEDLNSNVGEEQMDLDSFEALPSSASCYSGLGQSNLSMQHEHDWLRITHCYNPWLDAKIKIRIFTPGMLHGLWAGRMFVSDSFSSEDISELNVLQAYDVADYFQLAQKHQAPDALFVKGAENYPPSYQRPFYMRIREHHCLSENLPIGWGQGFYDRESDGLSNAYFPPGTEFAESRVSLPPFSFGLSTGDTNCLFHRQPDKLAYTIRILRNSCSTRHTNQTGRTLMWPLVGASSVAQGSPRYLPTNPRSPCAPRCCNRIPLAYSPR